MKNFLYIQDGYPVFQNMMYSSHEAAVNCEKGDIILAHAPSTGIVTNIKFDPNKVDYNKDYHNEQGNSPAFKIHLKEVASIVMSHIGINRIVEIGCGKGIFLNMLADEGADVTGYDPTYDGNDPKIKPEYFDKNSEIHCKGIILRHVLEHIQDPLEFLSIIKENAPDDAKIYIEVPNLDWIINNKAWYDIFYEHVNYFRMNDFKRFFGKNVVCGELFGGQYIYLIAELKDLITNTDLIEGADELTPFNFFSDLKVSLEKIKNQKVILWGGASKGVIFAMHLLRNGINVKHIIDINKFKQNKFIASSGLKIESPEKVIGSMSPSDTIIVMNGNYLEEVKAMTNFQFNYLTLECL